MRKLAARPLLALGAAIALAGTGAYWMASPSPAAAEANEPGIGQDFWVEVVADGLEFPWGIAWLPDGDILVTERNGGLRRIHEGKLLPDRIAGVPATFQAQQNGLQDIALDPDFASNQRIFLSLVEGNGDAHWAALYTARYTPKGLKEIKRLFRSVDETASVGPSVGPLLFLPDKTLLMAVTDNHYMRHRAQRLDSHIGKLVRLNRDGTVPADNPFVGKEGALPEIWSYGHRVPLGLYRDPDTDRIWEVEPGPKGGDEMNLVEKGKNYGWAKASWGFDYNGGPAADGQSFPGMVDPVVAWTPSQSPSGIIRYKGDAFPQWKGDYFVGALTTMKLFRIRLDDKRELDRETLLSSLGDRIRSIKEGPDGFIYILTDMEDGRVLRLRPGKPTAAQMASLARPVPPVDWAALAKRDNNGGYATDFNPGDASSGKALFVQKCAACHSVKGVVEGGQMGPDLTNVWAYPAGKVTGFAYSPAFTDLMVAWDRFSLNHFLANPQGYIKGTAMAAPPVTDPQQRRDLVAFLRAHSDKDDFIGGGGAAEFQGKRD
jgi:glucose/arabinose dehydrogenase/cytochrome c2